MGKNEDRIVERIKALENGLFGEDDIKLLLIEIREKLQGETILKEICHFMAHPERDKGICHKKIDVRYAKIKFMETQTKQVLTSEFIQQNKDKPERFFTDAMLDYMKTDAIEKSLFDLVILAGMEDIENKVFLKYYNLNRKQIRKILDKVYKLEENKYVIKPTLSQREYAFIDDILKFIRGTIIATPAFLPSEIINEFIGALKRLSKELNYALDVDKIKLQENDLVVCLLSLLHDVKFKLFDGSEGRAYLSVHPKEENYVICLMSESPGFNIPLIVTESAAENYIETATQVFKDKQLQSIPWCYSRRGMDGILKLREN